MKVVTVSEEYASLTTRKGKARPIKAIRSSASRRSEYGSKLAKTIGCSVIEVTEFSR